MLRRCWELLKGLGLIAAGLGYLLWLAARFVVDGVRGIDRVPRDDFGQPIDPDDVADELAAAAIARSHRGVPEPRERNRLT